MLRKSITFACAVLACLVLVGCSGNAQGEAEQSVINQTNGSEQRLLISVIETENKESAKHSSTSFSDAYGKVVYHHLESVDIQLDGVTKPLEEALQDHSVSIPEIIAWAILDAENGICKEMVETKRGLTMFRYIYREFELQVFNDVYQTPDGKEHLIRKCTFYSPEENVSLRSIIITDENGAYLDREDWGISLELVEVSPSDITFQVHQSGGQHIGSLVTDLFELRCITTETHIHDMWENIQIENNGTTTISLNWEEACGRLASGKYTLSILMTDIFTEEQRHPLMLDYHETQGYGLEFEIP